MEPLSLVNTALSLFSGRSETVEAVAPPAGLFSSLMTSAEGPVPTPPPTGTTTELGEGFSDWSGLMARTDAQAEGLEAPAPVAAPVALAEPTSPTLPELPPTSETPGPVVVDPPTRPHEPFPLSIAVTTPTVPSMAPESGSTERSETAPPLAPLAPPLRKDGKVMVLVEPQEEVMVEEETDGPSEEVEKTSPGEKKRGPSPARARTNLTEELPATHGPLAVVVADAIPAALALPLPIVALAGEGGGEGDSMVSPAGERAEGVVPLVEPELFAPLKPNVPTLTEVDGRYATASSMATLASASPTVGSAVDLSRPEDVAVAAVASTGAAPSRPSGQVSTSPESESPTVVATLESGPAEVVAPSESPSSTVAPSTVASSTVASSHGSPSGGTPSLAASTTASTSAGALAASTPTLTAVTVAPSNPLPRRESEGEGRVGARTGKPLVRSLVEIAGQSSGPGGGLRTGLQPPLPTSPLEMAPEPPTALNPVEPAGGADLPEVETETEAHFEAPSLSAAPSEGAAPEGPRAAPERLTAAHFPHRLEELRSELLEQGKERHLVSLELEPEHLGKVRVSLSCEPASEKVRALLSVTSGETARVLDKALNSAGTDGLAISIEIGTGTSEGRGWADSPTRPPLPPRRTESPSEATLASLVEPTPRVAPRGLYA